MVQDWMLDAGCWVLMFGCSRGKFLLHRRMISVRYHRGLELPEHALWLDSGGANHVLWPSSRTRTATTSRGTRNSSPARARPSSCRRGSGANAGGAHFPRVLAQPAQFHDFQITLLPAGHIFGSAQALVESDRGSLLYTGDFKLRPGLSAEPAQWRHAETLIMETTYGLPKYCLPPTEEVMAKMVAFCRETLEDGGGAGALRLFAGQGSGNSLRASGRRAHPHAPWRGLQDDGDLPSIEIRAFPDGYLRYAAGEVDGKVLVCPPSANRTLMLTRIKNRRVAVLTGWALDPGATYRYQCDAAFPLSDHADYTDLVRYVELVQPRRVLTLHGFAGAFAADLRAGGVGGVGAQRNQPTSTGTPRTLRASQHRPARSGPASSSILPSSETAGPIRFSTAWPPLGEQIAGTTPQQIAKGRPCSPVTSARSIPQLYPGRGAFPHRPRFRPGRQPHLAGRLGGDQAGAPRRGAAHRTGIPRHFPAVRRRRKDRLRSALLRPHHLRATFLSTEAAAFFDQLQSARGPIAKGALLQQCLAALTPLEASYVVRILTGDHADRPEIRSGRGSHRRGLRRRGGSGPRGADDYR